MAESSLKRKRVESVACEPMSPDGDLILAVGEPAERLLRVSSSVLANASSVFKAMLSGQVREALALRSKEAPCNVRLPEDNPSGMADMCALSHHNMETMRNSLWSTSRIYKLAMTIDKYDCTTTLQLQCQALMLQYLDRYPLPTNPEEAAAIVTSAYILNDARTFEAITSRVIKRFTITMEGLRMREQPETLPTRMLLFLEEKRTRAQRYIMGSLPLTGMPPCAEACDNYDDVFLQNLKKAFSLPYWPPNFNGMALSDALNVLRHTNSIDRRESTCECTGNILGVDAADLNTIASKVESMCSGLCLKCIKADHYETYDQCSQHYRGACFDCNMPTNLGHPKPSTLQQLEFLEEKRREITATSEKSRNVDSPAEAIDDSVG